MRAPGIQVSFWSAGGSMSFQLVIVGLPFWSRWDLNWSSRLAAWLIRSADSAVSMPPRE